MSGGWPRSRRSRPDRGDVGRAIIERLAAALSSPSFGDDAEVIAPAAVLVVDSGGHLATAPIVAQGRSAVVDGLRDLMTGETSPVVVSINGDYGVTLVRAGTVVGAITAEADGGALTTIWAVCNPDKLRHWNTASPPHGGATLSDGGHSR